MKLSNSADEVNALIKQFYFKILKLSRLINDLKYLSSDQKKKI